MIGRNPYEGNEPREPIGYYVARKIDPSIPGSKFRTRLGKSDGSLLTKEEAEKMLPTLRNPEDYEIVPIYGSDKPIGLGSSFPPEES